MLRNVSVIVCNGFGGRNLQWFKGFGTPTNVSISGFETGLGLALFRPNPVA